MKLITLDEIKELGRQEKLFILTMGAPAAGKTTFVKKHLSEFRIIDVDELSVAESGVKNIDSATDKNIVSARINMLKILLNEAFSDTQTFINVSTSKNIKGLLNKLKLAHKGCFLPTLIYFDVSLDICVKRNRNRILEGKKGVKKSDEWKIESIDGHIKNNLAALKDSNLIDYLLIVKDLEKLKE